MCKHIFNLPSAGEKMTGLKNKKERKGHLSAIFENHSKW